MKYVDEFRDGELARGIGARIAAEVRPDRRYSFMEFCGGHTHAISRYGIAELLPEAVHMIHGPGCPVCVLPIGRIDQAIGLALDIAPQLKCGVVWVNGSNLFDASAGFGGYRESGFGRV